MNKKMFYTLLLPVYLLLAVWVLFLLVGLAGELNVFFYLVLALFVPCACWMSLEGQGAKSALGTVGYILLGVSCGGAGSSAECRSFSVFPTRCGFVSALCAGIIPVKTGGLSLMPGQAVTFVL